MNNIKYFKKFRFSYFLPYGIVSQPALQMDMKEPNSLSKLIYSLDTPMADRIRECEKERTRKQAHLRKFETELYSQAKDSKYGKRDTDKTHYFILTRHGINAICGYPDMNLEDERVNKLHPDLHPFMDDSWIFTLMPDEEILDYQDLLQLESARTQSDENEAAYQDYLKKILSTDRVSILASNLEIVPQVKTTSRFNGIQIYRQWRLTNIHALFKANGFLTSIDRRPMCPPITDKIRKEREEAYQAKIASGTLDFATYADYTISKWYDEHPDSYYYLDPVKQLTDAEYEQWFRTPAFYATTEIPGLSSSLTFNEKVADPERNSGRVCRTTCMGVAIGTKENFAVYHTRTSHMTWRSSLERKAKQSIDRAISEYGETTNIPGADRTIHNAIMVCPTVFQFAALFRDAIRNHKEHVGEKRIGVPYDAVSIITLDQSGSHLFQMLMRSNQQQYLEKIQKGIKLNCPFLSEVPDRVFSFTYNGTPVLLAHTMEWNRIYQAFEKYLDGDRFYIMCFPEQVKYLSKLMPECTFL